MRSGVPASGRLERVLLHLLQHHRARSTLVSPHWVTQDGIASRTGIARPNVSRALAELESAGLVVTRVGPVEGEGRYKKVYFLSDAGESKARDLPGATGGQVSYPPSLPWPRFVVGRVDETKAFGAWLRAGQPDLMLVQGMAGIGKTTLLLHAIDTARGARSTFYFKCAAWSTAELLARELAAFAVLHDRTQLRGLLDRTGSASPPGAGEVAMAFRRDAEELRCLLVIDDYHEATPEVEQLVSALAHAVRGGSVRIAAGSRTARAPFDARATATDASALLRLGGLPPGPLREVTERVRGSRIDDATAASIHRATGGNPLFAQLLGDPGATGRPGDAQEYLRSELLDRLSAEERGLALRLAVLRTPAPPAKFLGGASEIALSSLAAKGVAYREGDAPDYWMHDLLRESFLASAPTAEISAAHLAVADRLRSSRRPEELAARLWHLARGGAGAELREALRKDGDALVDSGHARSVLDALAELDAEGDPRMTLLGARANRACGRLDEAVKQAAEAARAAPSPADRIAALSSLADIHSARRENADAERAARDGLALLNRVRDRRIRAGMRRGLMMELGAAQARRRKVRPARTTLRRCLLEARRARDRRTEAAVEENLGVVSYYTGEVERARSHFLSASRLYRLAGDLRASGSMLNNVGFALAETGDYSGAERSLTGSLRLAERMGDAFWQANSLLNLHVLHSNRGANDLARHYARRALEISESHGMARLTAKVLNGLADIQVSSGDPDGAMKHLDLAEAAAADLDDAELEFLIKLTRAQAYVRLKDRENADRYVAEAQRSIEGDPSPGMHAALEATRASAALAAGDGEKAWRHATTALRHHRRSSGDFSEMAEALEVAAQAALATGRTARGRTLLEEAAAMFARMGAPAKVAACRLMLRRLSGRGADTPGVAHVLIVNRAGALLASWHRDPSPGGGGADRGEMIGEVLHAVTALVRETLGLEEEHRIRSFSIGPVTLTTETAAEFSLVAVVEGDEPSGLGAALRSGKERFAARFGDRVKSWRGDLSEFEGARELLAGMVASLGRGA